MTTIEQFYEVLRDFVIYYPINELSCLRPNVFGVLSEYADLNAPNMGMTFQDKDKPYFWSRKWELENYNSENISFELAGLFLFEENIQYENLIKDKLVYRTYNYELAVLDNYVENCNDTSDLCKGRVRNEIYRDTEIILMNLFFYLRDVVYARFDDTFNRYIHTAQAAALIAAGTYTTIVTDLNQTRLFQESINAGRKDNIGLRYDTGDGTLSLYGSVIKLALRIPYPCPSLTFNWDFNRYEFKYNPNCC